VVAFRPEDVNLAPSAVAGANQLRATVETVAYLGERIEYVVRTAGGRSFVVFSSRRDRYEVGDSVGLQVDTQEATVWAA
jgi:ABC-type Fe3+/spermidine/putrescine transport system ATPase subunit